jgi:outer membrane receptor protein involved in Fe transport
MKKSFILLIFSLLTVNIFAQAITVNGKLVTSSDNEGLPFVTVLVVDEATPETVVQRFATDADGEFSTTLNPGTYIFTFHFVGMTELSKTVEVSAEQNPLNLGEIVLDEDATLLGEVSVVAQRQLVRVEIDRLTYNVQDDPEASTSNVLDMMRRVPLLTVDGEDNIQLRGSSSFRIHLNGRPSNMISNNPREVLRSMPASNILRIEVITDPGARYDAEGVGGIINIVTNRRVDDGYQGSVGTRADSFGGFGGNASLTLRRGLFGFSGNLSHSENRRPESTFESVRTDSYPLAENTLTQEGRNSGRGGGTFGNAQLTFEPDTLNLFSTSFNLSGWNNKGYSDLDVLSTGARNFAYSQTGESEWRSNNWSLNTDYQRSFRRNREELLTFSYRVQNNPGSNAQSIDILEVEGDSPRQAGLRQRLKNNERGTEQTVQLDYINPISRQHVIEAGVRFIYRHNTSAGENLFLTPGSDIWQEMPGMNNDLDHRQQIASGYAGYMFRADRFSIRTGLRAERTHQTVEMGELPPFSADFFNLVPSAALSYQIQPTTTLRFNYGMRIQRPGIWQLNPFVFNADPTNIRYGNPDLKPVNSHSFSLTFGHFASRFNINASANYHFSNNSILWFQFIEYGVVHNTVDNIGRQQGVNFHLHGSWNPIQALRMSVNAGVNYTQMQGNEEFNIESNSGFSGNGSGNIVYTFPRHWRLSANFGYFSPWIGLQSRGSAHHWHSMTAGKDFLDRKLSVNLNIQNPLQRTFTWENEFFGPGFTGHSQNISVRRSVSISVNYRFGELRSSMRRVQRGIALDDVMQGEGGGQGGGQ